jgi:electron transport complex protein RnfC
MVSLPRFRHGVHPPDHKQLTAAVPIRRMPFPEELVLPVRQHAGAPARLIVKAGDRVERGDKVAEADGFMSVPIHASAAGTVVEAGLVPHPDGAFVDGVRIAVERFSAQLPRARLVPEWEGLTPPQIVAAVQDAGVVGLGGAAFPTHVKLSPPEGRALEVIILNGCECEPYLTTDHRTMVEHPGRVLTGLRIMMRCLNVERAIIGIEANKPDAVAAITAALPGDLDIQVLPLTVKYPQGAEKMLIDSVLGRQVPSGGLPLDVGVLVQNVASVATIAEVFETGLPLIERIVTVTGPGVRKPSNLVVPVGTPMRVLLDACGGLTDDAAKVVTGGPMMGAAVADLDAPVLKGTTGLVALTAEQCRSEEMHPCIRCGRCLDACPVFLDPQRLGALAKVRRYDEMPAHHLRDCMVCGCCSYVCPSNIPLSQLFRLAKDALKRAAPAA